MEDRKARARWYGSVEEGAGQIAPRSGTSDVRRGRVNGALTNPRELPGECGPTALPGRSLMTMTFVNDPGYQGPRIEPRTQVSVSGLDKGRFPEFAEAAKIARPATIALAGVEITSVARPVDRMEAQVGGWGDHAVRSVGL